MLTQYYDFHKNFMNFGCTDLRKGVSGANFDAESDFEVRLADAPHKPGQNYKNLNSESENNSDLFF